MRKFKFAIIIYTILIILLPVTVFAHLDLASSFPASGDKLEEVPEIIQLWFNEELDTFESSLMVFDSSGLQIDNRDHQVNPDDRRELFVTLPTKLLPDIYTIKWDAVDDQDGHPIEGEIHFTIMDLSSQPNQQFTFSSSTIVVLLSLSVIVIFSLSMMRKKNNI